MVRRSRLRKFTLRNVETGRIHRWSLPTILREINRDRSGEWTPYNRRDWKEGLAEFTEFRLVGRGRKS
jgi:hypothetical protein